MALRPTKRKSAESAEANALPRGKRRTAGARPSGEADGLKSVAGDAAGEFILSTMPGHLIRRLQQVAVALFMQAMDATGADLTPVQYAALKAVQTYPSIDQATLAGVIAYDRTTIGGVVDRLESKGLIRRQLSSSDRRVRQLVIERAGAMLIRRLEPKVAEIQDKILSPLGAEERLIFVMLLKKLAQANNEQSRAPLRPMSGRSPRALAAE